MKVVTLVKSNGAEYDYQADSLLLGQLLTLEDHPRPYYVKSIENDGRYHILPVTSELPDPPEEIFLTVDEDPIKYPETEYDYSVWYPHRKY